MASFVAPRSQLLSPVAGLLLLATIVIFVISFSAVADCGRVVSAPPLTTAAKPPKPIEVFPGCTGTLMPKGCSVRLSKMAESVVSTKVIITEPPLAAAKLMGDSCITECSKVLDEMAPKVIAGKSDKEAMKALKGYLSDKVVYNDGPIGPCECNCPEPCSADKAAAVKKMGEVTDSMRNLAELLRDLFDSGADSEDEAKKADAAEAEKSMDSGVLHVSCGLTREPVKCSDELSTLAKTTDEDKKAFWHLQKESQVKPGPALDAVITGCIKAIDTLNKEVYSSEARVKDLAAIHASIRSHVQGEKPPCKYSCPPPPEKPCTANETAIVDKMSGVRNRWVAAEKFLTELLPPAKEAPK